MPNAQCPMPNAQCPMPNAQCPMPNAPCPMPTAVYLGIVGEYFSPDCDINFVVV
ncbi:MULTISPECIES: hypothetical protein [unclassified Tolypothrix]|uniref:hypothetical protein n=1 Tax=unclassified Tolypothrix TaxID=2649714 RepID=UPI000A43AE90|nr:MULTISPECIES: hypothetical protein [unclassified Tolypothrix]UYD24681.1 hypothetical protein HGR01_25090 [Tolypothrix sp. PCC 7712]UYD33091.1 hypothetical protein HG267_29575 [Tolypothrix sp. PCC 7601]